MQLRINFEPSVNILLLVFADYLKFFFENNKSAIKTFSLPSNFVRNK